MRQLTNYLIRTCILLFVANLLCTQVQTIQRIRRTLPQVSSLYTRRCDKATFSTSQSAFTFDYIIVGTGPGGAAMARLLSDDGKTSVLLLEAGLNHDNDTPIKDSAQANSLDDRFHAKYFWQGSSIPQEGLNGESTDWTTGRLAGGGSSINGEQYVRTSVEILKEWEKLLGPLWSPANVIKNYKELETYNGKTPNPAARGFHGPVDVRQAPANPTNMNKKLVNAIVQATSARKILDYNDPKTPLGAFEQWQLTQQPNGNRESSSTAFLEGVVDAQGNGLNGRKLKLLYKTTATRVVFFGKRAVGLQFSQNGVTRQMFARKKVILAAGINDAQILMNSGVGPADMLRKANIPVVFDNPNVGLHLRNQPISFAVFKTNPADRAVPADDLDSLYTGGAFLPDPTGANPHKRSFQLIGLGSAANTFEESIGMDGNNNLLLLLILLEPKSQGFIKLQSSDPLQIVLANEAFYQNPDDLKLMVQAFKVYVRNIAEKLHAIDPLYELIAPTQEVLDDEQALEEYIKTAFIHNHHMQSSCKMASLKDGGVLDAEGNVHGVEGLIVADAQSIPVTSDGNTSAPAYLIGFTIAKQLLKDQRRA